MIIGNNRKDVINNIKQNIENGEFNKKVEINDPVLTEEEKDATIKEYLNRVQSLSYKINNKIANLIANYFTVTQNKDTEIVGMENIKNIKTGAIITSNHFSPLDNTIIRKFIKQAGKKKTYIVVQETNLAMKGALGYLMKYTDNIPITDRLWYMKKDFQEIIKEKLSSGNFILIYPEQEMWFNYRKPRTLKPGAYYYASKNNVPIISCFVEIIDKNEKDTEEFNKVKYILHVLPPIYPDKNKTEKENSIEMMEIDYNQKKEAYEKAYNHELDYKFDKTDIAGWI